MPSQTLVEITCVLQHLLPRTHVHQHNQLAGITSALATKHAYQARTKHQLHYTVVRTLAMSREPTGRQTLWLQALPRPELAQCGLTVP
jgi:hypothetical protein